MSQLRLLAVKAFYAQLSNVGATGAIMIDSTAGTVSGNVTASLLQFW